MRRTAPAARIEAGTAPIARLMTAKHQLSALSQVLQAYGLEHHRFPQSPWPSAYRELVPNYGTKEELPAQDPWGQAYRYATSTDGLTYVLTSPGNDGVYQNSEAILLRLLSTKCHAANGVLPGNDDTVDLVVCNGVFLTLVDDAPVR